MRFVDEAVITVRSGDGGRGCISFRREKYLPRGGPDGGDGGRGGDIIARAAQRLYTLGEFNSRKSFRARSGQPGRGKNQTGKNGEDVFIEVPLGTIISEYETGDVLADLILEGQEVLVLPGGRGGRGNQHFATPTNRAPRIAQPGLPGRQKKLKLVLKHLADIGLIGLPNAGKSTLLSRLTSARPKIDSYPFSTLTPNLGVLTLDDGNTLTVADIPGLIEGAGEGRGLGHRFLRHVERTKLLLHLLDLNFEPGEDILEDYLTLRKELKDYSPLLEEKNHIVLINKIDLVTPGRREVGRVMKALEDIGVPSLPISALTGEGLDELRQILGRTFFDV
ncbi:MAG: GTPase ObgE [Deltaproteobacteria bacterium]|nr:GTPase ObgE [Deltaproteobacteria bacterium]